MATKTSKTTETTDTTEVADTTSAATVVEQASTTDEASTVAESIPPAAFQITLKEFIQSLSQRDNRVELVNAFYFVEKQAGHVKDYESNFQSRYVAFTQLPIED